MRGSERTMSNLKTLLIMALFVSTDLVAVTLNISVSDANGHKVKDAIVYVENNGVITQPSAAHATQPPVIMDQIGRQFNPHILAIRTGQQVHFPNSDSIQHHVYSFSPTKAFELQLYKSNDTQIMQFNDAGVVELGCNIHDWMIGYIFVSPTRWFAQTNTAGHAKLDLSGMVFSALAKNNATDIKKDITLRVWHPALDINDIKHTYTISLVDPKANNDPFPIHLKHTDFSQYAFPSELDDEFAEYE